MNEINKKIENSRVEKAAEQKEKLPEMKIKFIFLRHQTEKDAELIENDLKECDIFCPEIFLWAEGGGGFLDDAKRALGGEESFSSSPEEKTGGKKKQFPEFSDKIIEFIHKYKKPVFAVDMPYNKENVKVDNEIEFIGQTALDEFTKGNLKNTIENIKKYIKMDAAFSVQREAIIAENFKNLLPKILEKYPELGLKNEIKILSSYGAFHTALYHNLKKEGIRVERIFPFKGFFYDRLSEISRRQRFFPEKEVSDEEAAKFLACSVLKNYFEALNNKQPLGAAEETKIVNKFLWDKINLSDMEKLCEEIKRHSEEPNFIAPFFIIKYFKEEVGLNIPKNKEELDELIENLK